MPRVAGRASCRQSERTLLDHIQAEVAKGTAASSNRTLSYRILLGQYHLTKVAQAIGAGRPPADYREHLRAHVDNQLRLFDETKTVESYPSGNRIATYSQEDAKLAEEIGIKMPGDAFAFTYRPFEVMREVGHLLMENRPSIMLVSLKGNDAPCLFQLDPSYSKLVPQVYQRALDYLDKDRNQYRERKHDALPRTLRPRPSRVLKNPARDAWARP